MSVTTSGKAFGGDADVRIVCLASDCNHEATSVKQHRKHIATADHPDSGEAYQ